MCMMMNTPQIKHRLQTQLSAGTRIQQEIVIWLQFSSPFFHTLVSSGALWWSGLRRFALTQPFLYPEIRRFKQ